MGELYTPILYIEQFINFFCDRRNFHVAGNMFREPVIMFTVLVNVSCSNHYTQKRNKKTEIRAHFNTLINANIAYNI